MPQRAPLQKQVVLLPRPTRSRQFSQVLLPAVAAIDAACRRSITDGTGVASSTARRGVGRLIGV